MTSPFTPPTGASGAGEPYPSAPPPDRGREFAPVDDAPLTSVGADYVTRLTGGAPTAPFVFPGTEEVDPAVVFAGPGYTSPRPPASTWARVAVVAAVLGVVPGISLIAVVTGHIALRETTRTRVSGRGMALAGLALGYIGAVVWLLLGIVWSLTL